MYFIRTPKLVKRLYSFEKEMDVSNNEEKRIFLTFDDGPFPLVTDYVLRTLNNFNLKATFFCTGQQIVKNPGIFSQIKSFGHQIGNHTFSHLKGWESSNFKYYRDILKAEKLTNNKIFRPPYGQIKQQQLKTLKRNNYKVFLWDVLPGDFDKKITKETCLKNAIDNTFGVSNIVFHDNPKSFEKLQYCLPKYLETMLNKGFVFDTIKA